LGNPDSMVEIRWHGRGGQGAVTSAEIMAQAAISEGKYAPASPSLGPERRGAPVQAFVRVSGQQIRVRSSITEPDVGVVLDPGLLKIVDVTSGLKSGGIVVINTTKTSKQIRDEFKLNARIATVGATKIAQEVLGVPITNTTMIGAVIKARNIVKIESLIGPLKQRFGRLGDRNIESMKRAYSETIVEELAGDQARR